MPGSPSFDLSGIWLDRELEIKITQTGNTVSAEYAEERPCDTRDGWIDRKKFAFTAKILDNNRLEGEINVCVFKTKVGLAP